jgi:hypothetical protein
MREVTDAALGSSCPVAHSPLPRAVDVSRRSPSL